MTIDKKMVIAVAAAVFFLVVLIPWALRDWKKQNEDIGGPPIRVLTLDGQIAAMALEDYLVGVVAAEMPAAFPKEALKAQAVAARTYALNRMQNAAESAYDVDTTTQTQVWMSDEKMREQWGEQYYEQKQKVFQAVKESVSEVLTYEGELISAFFYSSSGRRDTEKAGDVWSNDLPYIINVSSQEIQPDRFVRHYQFAITDFGLLLGLNAPLSDLTAQDIRIVEYTATGRIKKIAVREHVWKGSEFRSRLGLSSTDLEWRVADGFIYITSYGNGHGVGMSQYGAKDMAESGCSYRDILNHFYPGTVVANSLGAAQ